jgi:hypothetical protein
MSDKSDPRFGAVRPEGQERCNARAIRYVVPRGVRMSLALILIALVVLLVGLPWLVAAIGFLFFAAARCCSFFWPSRALKTPIV